MPSLGAHPHYKKNLKIKTKNIVGEYKYDLMYSKC